MGNFFGLFNYNKVGPGVSKNEPKKKGIFEFFDIYFSKFGKLVFLNIIYVISCLPVVTFGAATAGFTYILRAFVRHQHTFVFSDYIEAIKKNWKQATIFGIIQLFISAAWFFAVVFYFRASESNFIFLILFGVCIAMGFFLLFMHYYIYLMIITFDLKLKQIYKNAFIFACIGIKSNIIITVSIALIIGFLLALMGSLPIIIFIIVIPMIIGLIFPATIGLIVNFNAYPVIKKYMIDPVLKEQEQSDKNEEDNIAPIFTDMGNEKDKA